MRETKNSFCLNKRAVWQLHLKSKRRAFRMSLNDINSLSHAKWNYKYHIVFAPRYRRKVFYYSTKKSGQQVTIPAQLADRITRLRVTRGTEDFARIGRTPGFTGGVLSAFSWLKPQKDINQWRKENEEHEKVCSTPACDVHCNISCRLRFSEKRDIGQRRRGVFCRIQSLTIKLLLMRCPR